jgi:predicted NUDIX family phosphoesterase
MSDASGKNRAMVLAVEAAQIPSRLLTRGFHVFSAGHESLELDLSELWVGPRSALETNEAFRQLIPYVVLHVGGKIVSYARTSAGSENRLHGKRSIGFGGHVELDDLVVKSGNIDLRGTLERATSREIYEEMGALEVVQRRWRGVLVDNRDAVDRVHMGIVAYWQLAEIPKIGNEAAIGDVQLAPPGDIPSKALEAWSVLVLSDLKVLSW